MMTPRLCPFLARAAGAVLFLGSAAAWSAPVAAVHEAAQAERQAMLDTMRDLVGIESGSKDVEGVERIAALVRDRLAALGGKAEIIQPAQVFRLDDTPEKVGPMVRAEFLGSGDKKIMLIAHMDTVYRNGMLRTSPSASTATRPMAWASPTTSMAWRPSSTPWPCCTSWTSAATARSPC